MPRFPNNHKFPEKIFITLSNFNIFAGLKFVNFIKKSLHRRFLLERFLKKCQEKFQKIFKSFEFSKHRLISLFKLNKKKQIFLPLVLFFEYGGGFSTVSSTTSTSVWLFASAPSLVVVKDLCLRLLVISACSSLSFSFLTKYL